MKTTKKYTKFIYVQLPYKMFRIEAFSSKNTYVKCIEEHLRDALNDIGHIGVIYKGLTKYIMANYGGSTTCLHSLITKTIALLQQNGI